MDILEAIKTRRSIGKLKDTEVPNETIEKILEAGIYAPNHFHTEPWRFFVLEGKARERLGEVFAEITKEQLKDEEEEKLQRKIEKDKTNPLRSPVIIAVGVEPSEKKQVILKEEYAAVNSAIQNMLLAAHGLGLGAKWRTGTLCYEKAVSDFFGLTDRGEIVAFLYIGYPDIEPKNVKKSDFNTFTTWMD